MTRPLDLESLRAVFADDRLHLAIAKITQLSLADDRSGLKVLVKLYPDQREIVCRMTWDAVGPDAGIFAFPSVDDLVLVAFAEGDFNQAFVIRRLTSKVDKIPARAADGHTIVRALDGKNSEIYGDQVLLGGGSGVPDEPLVLGNVLVSALTDLIAKFDAALTKIITGPMGIGNLGAPVPTFPALVMDLTAIKVELEVLKSTYIDTEATNIVSKVAFTEKE